MKKIFSSGIVSISALAVLLPSSVIAQQFSEENLKAIAAEKQKEMARSQAALEAATAAAKTSAASAKRSGGMVVPSPSDIGVFDGMVGSHPSFLITNNLNAAKTISTDDVWSGGSAGLSLNGSGQKIGIWDGGSVLSSHVEFGGRVTVKDAVASNEHSTHVGATLIASGVDANAKGMASSATLDSYDITNDISEMTSAALPAGGSLALSNHSYGAGVGWYVDNAGNPFWGGDIAVSTTEDYKFGFYDSRSYSYDRIVYNAPSYVLVQSAGNSRGDGPATQPFTHLEFRPGPTPGTFVIVVSNDIRPLNGTYDTLPTGGSTAKNTITVGAVSDIPSGYSSPSDVVMTSFSSWGPTDDGRIKPDLVANGDSVYSASNASNSSYVTLSGTSMAAPTVTGSVALLKQHWNNLFVGSAPLAATVKAVLINTADEAGPNAGPDYSFGWGLMNTQKAAALISTDASAGADFNIRELGLASTDSVEFPVNLSSSSAMRATIAWTDPETTPLSPTLNSTTSMLKHDLDLRIVGASTFSPWVLNPASPASAATTGDNTRDNVERIDVASPTTGTYRATISHKGTLTKPGQNFSFAISGATRPSDFWTTTITKNSTTSNSGRKSCEVFDSSGNRFFATDLTTTVPGRVRITKYNPDGDVLWTTTWSSGSSSGTESDHPIVLRTDSSGNLFMAARGQFDAYIVKYSAAGVKQWEDSYDRVGNIDTPKDMAISSAGDAYVAIASVQNSGYYTWVTIKYLAGGTKDWTKTFSPSGSASDVPRAIAVDSTGACYIAGVVGSSDFGGHACLLKYNSNGAKAWDQQNTTDEWSAAWDVAIDSSGNPVVLTTVCSVVGLNPWQFQTIKYNSAGAAQWINRMSAPAGTSFAYPRSLVIDGSNNVFITGYRGAKYEGEPAGTESVITAKYTSAGLNSWVSTLSYDVHFPGITPFDDTPYDTIKVDSSGNVLVAATVDNGSNLDAGLIKLNSSGTFVSLRTYGSSLSNTDDYQWSGPDIATDGSIYIQSWQSGKSINSTTAFRP